MLPLLRRLFVAFFTDELAFKRWLRGLVLAFSASGLAFADQLAPLVDAPVKGIKIAAVVAGFIAGSISHGERNPKPDAAP